MVATFLAFSGCFSIKSYASNAVQLPAFSEEIQLGSTFTIICILQHTAPSPNVHIPSYDFSWILSTFSKKLHINPYAPHPLVRFRNMFFPQCDIQDVLCKKKNKKWTLPDSRSIKAHHVSPVHTSFPNQVRNACTLTTYTTNSYQETCLLTYIGNLQSSYVNCNR